MAVNPAHVKRARELLQQYGPWLRKYSGGIPPSFMAESMRIESNGNPNAGGDVALGEVGIFQIAAYVPKLFGYDVSVLRSSENNTAIAALEYQYESVLWHLRYPKLVRLGTADSYKLGRLSFAIGRAGSYNLADRALAAGYLQPGAVYDGIRRHVAAVGAPSLGSQSPEKVVNRVIGTGNAWEVAMAAEPGNPGLPELVPAPPAGPYTIPAPARPFFIKPIPAIMWILGGAAGLLYYVWTRR